MIINLQVHKYTYIEHICDESINMNTNSNHTQKHLYGGVHVL